MARVLGASLLSVVLVAACYQAPAASSEPTSSAAATPAPTTRPVSPTASPSASPTQVPISPSGLLLAFRGPSENRTPLAVLMNVSSGAMVDLGRVDEASWSSDGARVHVVRQGSGCVPSLRTVATDGSVVSTVTRSLKSEDLAFTWSPNQHSVAFLRFHSGPPQGMCGSQGGSYPDADVRTDLVVMADDGAGQRVLVTGGWPWKLSWSPDGTRIAFLEWVKPLGEALGRLSIVDVANGTIRHLTGTLEMPDQVAWSPDGSEIRIRSIDALDQARHVASVDPASGATHELFVASSRTRDLAWSPDGRLAAAAVEIVAGDGAITGADIDIWDLGSATKVTLKVANAQPYVRPPAWAPNGTWLAFTATDPTFSRLGGIELATIDGADRRHVPASTDFEVAAWQPE